MGGAATATTGDVDTANADAGAGAGASDAAVPLAPEITGAGGAPDCGGSLGAAPAAAVKCTWAMAEVKAVCTAGGTAVK